MHALSHFLPVPVLFDSSFVSQRREQLFTPLVFSSSFFFQFNLIFIKFLICSVMYGGEEVIFVRSFEYLFSDTMNKFSIILL